MNREPPTRRAWPTAHRDARSIRPARRWFLAAGLLAGVTLVAAWCAPYARAEQGDGFTSREYPLKALFLYNFGHYVEWPKEAFVDDQQPFVIGLLGSTPVDATLREIAAARQIAGRRIVVKQFASLEAVTACQILFVARTVRAREAEQLLERLRGLAVLIVGESDGFAARGGCVNFYIQSNKIRFEINLEAAKQQNLRMSAKLLALAKIVP